MAELILGATIEVVRIPELPPKATLANDDAVPIWDASTNVTKKVSLSDLRTFIETGSGGTVDQILSGGSILYIASGGDGFEGTDSFVYSSIAGFSFKLTRDGYPLKRGNTIADAATGAEFLVLAAGGFMLIDGTVILPGQRYELDVFELYNGMVNPPTGVSTGGWILGSATINTNVNVSVNDMRKVHQIRGTSTARTITLPDIALCAENDWIIFEALINNSVEHRITTTSGQLIYLNNEGKASWYIRPGEYLWLYRTTDGWFAINDKGNWSPSCIPQPAYKVGLNQVACEGQTLSRTVYARLWEAVQTLGASLVSDATWNTVSAVVASRTVTSPYRGCFSTGDGSTTFRLPDFRGSAVRGLVNPGGSDSQRHFNSPGGFQRSELEAHTHTLQDDILVNGSAGGGEDGANNHTNISAAAATGITGGTESRMDNIGLIWVINY